VKFDRREIKFISMAISKDAATALILAMAAEGNSIEILMQTRNHKRPKNYNIGYSGNKRGSFTPDAVIRYESQADFFSIEEELSKANQADVIYKWILFSMEAKKLKGKLFLVVPKSKEFEYTSLIDWKQIDATVLSV